jgi:dipeptidase E
MKLVLYSGGYANENSGLDKSLISLFTKKDLKLTFIPSCSYHSNEDYSDILEQYQPFGIKKFLKFNIDQPFSDTLKNFAFQSDIIHLGGGNTFYFLKYLRKTGLLKELRSWVKNGGVLTGLSAGAILMTNKIETASFPSFDRDENEEGVKNLSALQLVDFEFFPHYRNSKRYDEELLSYSMTLDSPLYACPDGSGIMINGDELRFIGKTVCFFRGSKYIVNKATK